MNENVSDFARSLSSNEAIKDRMAMLHQPHIVRLTKFVEYLGGLHADWEFPYFDPLDGGSDADIMFLFEKPGPKTSAHGGGSGFISRNNDDPTAEATYRFMKEAGLARKRTVIWNVVPGWNNTRKVTSTELQQGIRDLKRLLPLLPMLRTIVLVGSRAERARTLIKPLGLRILNSVHPSPIVRATQPEKWKKIPSRWAQAGGHWTPRLNQP